MSDSVGQSYQDGDGRSGGQSMHSYQSVWMAHWTRTSCNGAPQSHNHSSNPFGDKVDYNDTKQTHLVSRVEIESDISRSAKRFKEVEVRTSELINKSRTMSLKNLRNEGRLNQGDYKFESRKTAVPSFMCRQEEINQLNSILAPNEPLSDTDQTILEKEHRNYHRHSAFLVSEEKRGNCSNSVKSLAPFLRQKNATLLPDIPSASKNPSVVFGVENYPRNHIFFSSQSSPPEMAELEKLHHGRSTLKMPQSVHDVETMRICTSVEGLAGGPPMFSQTTHSFLITKKTDVSLCKENKIFRESRVSTQLTGNALGGHHNLSPLFGHGRVGVKLQSISSSTDIDGEEDIPDFKAFEGRKNESSTETDTMDMDPFKGKNHLSGAYASPSNKVIAVDPSVSPQPNIALARDEVKYGQRITELPDINVELPAPPAAGSSMDNTEPSTSKTQSLDMELLFPSVDLTNPKSNQSPCGSLGPDPNSRWIKRLKLSAANSIALGTKSSKLGESSPLQMANMFFGKIPKGSISNTELTLGTGGSSSADTATKEGDITLSHPWIQRWRHNRDAPQNKGESEDCGPQRSKKALEDFQKKRFPSIAAMALMGKAMTGFQPCEFQKRGSFVVWNTRGF